MEFTRDTNPYLDRALQQLEEGCEECRLTALRSHIYKRHARPHQCPRCWQSFTEESLYQSHQVAEERCTAQAKKPADGYSKSQEKELRSKKRNADVRNEQDKWVKVYRILFPEDDAGRIPSPCEQLVILSL